jgi:hypothetical protein
MLLLQVKERGSAKIVDFNSLEKQRQIGLFQQISMQLFYAND